MASKLLIKNIKNVGNLEFDIPKSGVYLLTGRNGSGKTTLLAALYRIGYRNAFSDYFRTTASNKKLDSFDSASVTYVNNNSSVSYNYGGSRWSPTPKRNAIILRQIGFPKVTFIAANARRIEPSPDEVKRLKPRPTRMTVANEVARILADDRFKDLKYVNTKRGGGSNRAYLLPSGKKGAYYSEKNFSLGELCVIKLVNEIDFIPNNSLVLIDEIEMALHPRAQAILLDYLIGISQAKKLTVIFSTHSSSLIKRAGRGRIIYLENDGAGNITCVPKCFPAQALGDIAIDEDISPDVLCFVEDEKATVLLRAVIDSALKKMDGVVPPVYRVVPVGGFKEVINFLANSDQIFSNSVRRWAVLDKDVENESLQEARNNNKHDFLAFYAKHEKSIRYLPVTPELGVYELFNDNYNKRVSDFKKFSGLTGLDVAALGSAAGLDKPLAGANKRKDAKAVLRDFVSSLIVKSGEDEISLFRKIFAFYVQEMEAKDPTFSDFAKELAFG